MKKKISEKIYIAALLLAFVTMPLYYGGPKLADRSNQLPGKSGDHNSGAECETTTLGEMGAVGPERQVYVGSYRVTFYTNAPDENDGYVDSMGNGITKTGNPVQPGFTAAVKHGSIPYGTIIYIHGLGRYIVDDCGVGHNQIDIAVDSKETAEQLGVKYCDVYVIDQEADHERNG